MPLPTSDAETVVEGSGLVLQLSRYSIASALALAMDFTVYVVLCAFAVNVPVAGVAGYAAGMIAQYALSSTFVFDVDPARKSAPRRLAEFAASGLLGLLLTGLVITALVEHFAAPPIVAKIVAVAASFFAVFLVRRRIVFAPVYDKINSDDVFVYSKSGTGN